ncbi:MAG: N-6 DNA methylase [Chloroflexota bacterium]|nr:N-6 DNA methylase [Chloroflexota bacterium]MDE2696368.1 N-6 DNA methylase [Chloroflexota bacterium]
MVGETASAEKARGAFYTPPALAQYLAEWAIRTPDDVVVEPSCGEAVFLEAAWAELRGQGRSAESPIAIYGYEIDAGASEAARRVVSQIGAPTAIETCDFFDVLPTGGADVVVGNPPYIRYQSFSGLSREKAQWAALAAGVRLGGLASSWAPFVVHAARFLKDAGRLALVLPAELLHVNYAAPVRRYLMERFGQVTLVTFERLIFPGVTTEVVLLLAEGPGPTDSIELIQVADVDALLEHRCTHQNWTPRPDDTKWSPALIAGGSLDLYRELLDHGDFVPLSKWGDVSLGAVSGRNSYFRISPSRMAEFGLGRDDTVDVLPPNGKALRGLSYSRKAHEELARGDEPTALFYPDASRLSAAAEEYISAGEELGVHRAYKCAVRDPWWRVPVADETADIFVTYMNHDAPRLISNGAGVHALNSVHCVALRQGTRGLGKSLLPIAALNSVTALGAELLGRSYGGGVLKVEPREAARLPVPSPEFVRNLEAELLTVEASAGRVLRSGKHDVLRSRVDSILLASRDAGITARFEELRESRNSLRGRRHHRGRSP